MPTDCNAELFEFAPVEGRAVVASFDGGTITSDAGALLLGEADRAIRLIERFASCFTDTRVAELVEHSVGTMVAQRVFGIALGYEDLIDHDELRHDPVLWYWAASWKPNGRTARHGECQCSCRLKFVMIPPIEDCRCRCACGVVDVRRCRTSDW